MINYDKLAGCDRIGAAGQHAVELGLRPEVRDNRLILISNLIFVKIKLNFKINFTYKISESDYSPGDLVKVKLKLSTIYNVLHMS